MRKKSGCATAAEQVDTVAGAALCSMDWNPMARLTKEVKSWWWSFT